MTKKIIMYFFIACLTVLSLPVQVSAESSAANTMTSAAKGEAQARAMLNRLNEIKTLTKSNLTFAQKKELRKEVRDIQKQMKSSSPGIYLSVGAIIIILLLLILLL